ncbi:MAG: hypothetical protein AABY87_14225 [bacterium]
MIWWKSPAEAIKDPKRFLAQVMVYGTIKDLVAVRKYFSDGDFLDVLKNPPPGVFDPRSWAYWNLMFDRYPPIPLPLRKFGEIMEEQQEGKGL